MRRRRRLKRVMWYVLCVLCWWWNVINCEPNLVLEVKSSNRYTYKALCTILKESLANKSKNNNNERSRQFRVFPLIPHTICARSAVCPHENYSTHRVSSKNNNTNWLRGRALSRLQSSSIHPSGVEWQRKKKRNAIRQAFILNDTNFTLWRLRDRINHKRKQ